MPSDGLDGPDLAIIGDRVDPTEALREIVRRLHATPEPTSK
jgi:hypothetical protein